MDSQVATATVAISTQEMSTSIAATRVGGILPGAMYSMYFSLWVCREGSGPLPIPSWQFAWVSSWSMENWRNVITSIQPFAANYWSTICRYQQVSRERRVPCSIVLNCTKAPLLTGTTWIKYLMRFPLFSQLSTIFVTSLGGHFSDLVWLQLRLCSTVVPENSHAEVNTDSRQGQR